MKTRILLTLAFSLIFSSSSHALLIAGQDIIPAPEFIIDDSPGATNFHQQAFDEAQGVTLFSDLAIDGGFISSGTIVNSHMIFLNTPVGEGGATDIGVEWMFDGDILGVMSDSLGTLEASSSALLGAPGTVYPSSFIARGMEGNDKYTFTGNTITVDMYVSEPGDWIRVVTSASQVPEPSSIALLGFGLVGFGLARRRKTN